jgi:hypothetical protein
VSLQQLLSFEAGQSTTGIIEQQIKIDNQWEDDLNPSAGRFGNGSIVRQSLGGKSELAQASTDSAPFSA